MPESPQPRNTMPEQDNTELPAKRPYHALSVIPDIDQKILQAVGEGKSLKAIAEMYQVGDTAIFHRVMKLPEYREKLEVGLELRMDAREAQLEAAESNVHVTRADRLLGHARWLAERCAPARFGAQQKVTGADGGPLTVRIIQFGETIDAPQQDVVDAQVIEEKP